MRGLQYRFDLRAPLVDWAAEAVGAIPGCKATKASSSDTPYLTASVSAGWLVQQQLEEWGVPHSCELKVKKAPTVPFDQLAVAPEDLEELKPAWAAKVKDFQRRGLEFLQRRLGGLAKWPCLTGDAELVVNRAGRGFRMRLDDLVHKANGGKTRGRAWDLGIPTQVRCMDDQGTIISGGLLRAFKSGSKEVFEITVEDSDGRQRSLKTTMGHRFLTPDGEKRLRELEAGHEVYIVGARKRKPRGKQAEGTRKKYLVVSAVHHHPHATSWMRHRKNRPNPYKESRVPLHRIVYEAHLSGITTEQFIARVKANELEGLTFVDPSVHDVHYIDGDAENNSINNLELLPVGDHQQHHAQEGAWRRVLPKAVPARVLSIEPKGIQPTYDLMMAGPHHNYAANDFIVHNCGAGKTFLGILFSLSYPGRTIIVTRASTTHQWAGQFRKFCQDGAVKVAVLDGTRGFRAKRAPKQTYTSWVRMHFEAESPGRIASLREQRSESGRRKAITKAFRRVLRALFEAGPEGCAVRDLPGSSGAVRNALSRFEDAGLVERHDKPDNSAWKPWVVRSTFTDRIISWHDGYEGPMLKSGEVTSLSLIEQAEDAKPAKRAHARALLLAHSNLDRKLIADRCGMSLDGVLDVLGERAAEANAEMREGVLDIEDDTDAVVVGWPVLTARRRALINWGKQDEAPLTVILDESHNAKQWSRWRAVDEPDGSVSWEPKSNTSASALLICGEAERVLCLTATPQPDRTRDLWAQLDLIDPWSFGKFRVYAMRYCGAMYNEYGIDSRGSSNQEELHKRLGFYFHIVTEEEAKRELPPLTRDMVWLPPAELASVRVSKQRWMAAKRRGATALLELKLCVTAAMKHPWLVKRVKDCILDEEKVVLFSGRRNDAENLLVAVQGMVAAERKKKRHDSTYDDFEVWMAHGGQSNKERAEILKAYIAHDGPGLIIGTIDAWGEAIDGLQSTNRALISMLPWNHGKLIQLEGRFDRLGGKVATTLEYVIAEMTVDEDVLDHVVVKAEDAGEVLGDGELIEMSAVLDGVQDEEEILKGFAAKLLAAEKKRKEKREQAA